MCSTVFTGGTLDIAAHEILPGKRLHEISVARGNDMGGHYFNQKCLEVFEEMFGKECLENWKTKYCKDFLDMERKIEEMKRKVTMEDFDIQFRVDRSLSNTYKTSSNGKDIQEFEKEFSKIVESSTRRMAYLILKNEFLREFVKQVVMAIEKYLTEIITDSPAIKTIFMVGGLAKSTFVRQYIETQFPECRVIVPEDPGVAVLKGAVLLGNRPQTIASRVARYSYGVRVRDEFVEGKHREEYKINRKGRIMCENVFEKLIEKGQVLKYGQRFTTTLGINAMLPETKQAIFYTHLYHSTQPSPMYVTEDGCFNIGGFEMHPPEGGWPDYCEGKVDIIVGEAEFRLVVSDGFGRNYESTIDFLLS